MAQRLYLPREQIFSNVGVIGAGYKLFSYETTTTTPLATYSDTALSSANANPTIADSAGRLGDIFVNDLKLYKMVLKDADDNTIWEADPVDPKTFNLNDFDPRPTSFWGTTAGTAAAYTLVADPTISAYDSKQTFYAACHLDNSAGSTLAIDGLAALTEKKYDGAGSKVDLEAGDKQAGQTYEYRNDGTDLVVLNPEKPYFDGRNLDQATTTVRGVKYLTNPITMSNGTDTDHDIDFTAGNAIFSGGDGQAAVSALTKELDATWAAGDAAGGLADALTIAADTTYYCFALSNTAGTSTDIGYDTSSTATNLLADVAVVAAGLTKYSFIENIITDSSANIIQFQHYTEKDRSEVIYDDPIVDRTKSDLSTGDNTIALTVPPSRIARIVVNIDNAGSVNRAYFGDGTGNTPTSVGVDEQTVGAGTSGTAQGSSAIDLLTDGSSQIKAKPNQAGVGAAVLTRGWY